MGGGAFIALKKNIVAYIHVKLILILPFYHVLVWNRPFYKLMHTVDTSDGKVKNRALLSIKSEKVHRLYPPQSQ